MSGTAPPALGPWTEHAFEGRALVANVVGGTAVWTERIYASSEAPEPLDAEAAARLMAAAPSLLAAVQALVPMLIEVLRGSDNFLSVGFAAIAQGQDALKQATGLEQIEQL